jgi:hypothetical protein
LEADLRGLPNTAASISVSLSRHVHPELKVKAVAARRKVVKYGKRSGIPGHLSGYRARADPRRGFGRERSQAPS